MDNNDNQDNNLKLCLEIVSRDSNDSMDEDNFQTSAKLIQLNQMGLSVEKTNTRKKRIMKKNTRVSSNNEDDLEEFDENFHENKIKFFNLNIQTNQNQNNKSINNNNFQHNSDKNLKVDYKNLNLNSSNPNINDINDNKYECNNSENNNIYQNSNSPDTKSKVNLMRVSSFSPNKKKRKIIMEEKQKVRGKRGSIYALEQKKEEKKEEEKKDEEKIYRKDKYGTIICKKNKKKVKVTFEENFEIVTPIESFKKYNVTIGIPKGEKYINRLEDCQCCEIF